MPTLDTASETVNTTMDATPPPRGRHRAPRTAATRGAEAMAIAKGTRPTGRHRKVPEYDPTKTYGS